MNTPQRETFVKLMIVDNDPTMRAVIRGIVARPTDEVVECSDGDEVLPSYEAFHPDWILMDIQMDRMSGLAATRLLKERHPHAHVAMLTQYRAQEFRDEAQAAGAEQYLLKDDLATVRESLLYPPPSQVQTSTGGLS